MDQIPVKKFSVSPLKKPNQAWTCLSPKSITARRVNTSTPNTPKSRKTVRFNTSPPNNLKNSTSFTQKSSVSNSRSPINQRKVAGKKHSPDQDYKIFIPSHLEVIKKLKNLSTLNKPIPFSREIPDNSLPYSKEEKQSKKCEEILRIASKDPLLGNSQFFDQFLSRVKETERIIRQESEFIKKVRLLKPGIKLTQESNGKKSVKRKALKKEKKKIDNAPRSCLRSGIMVKDCFGY